MNVLLHLIAVVMLASLAVAQERSGRNWHRASRLVSTPNAAPAVDAGHARQQVAPLRLLRSGRAWPHHHFRRLPQTSAPKASTQAVDASARTTSPRRRGFWRTRPR